MKQLEDIKKKFLNGEVSAFEYEKTVRDLSSKKQIEETSPPEISPTLRNWILRISFAVLISMVVFESLPISLFVGFGGIITIILFVSLVAFILKLFTIFNDNSIKRGNKIIILSFLVLLSFILYLISNHIKSNEEIIDSNNNKIYERQKKQVEIQEARKDSLNKIASKKRNIEILREEAIFMKTKAGRIYGKHPDWSREDCEKLANNQVWIGMDFDMLKYKRGLPNSANPSNYGGGTQWQWCWSDYTPSCYYDTDGDGKIDSYN